ncbi:MAG: pyrimidine-nucleoside phosphorylase [Clostridia bacterium]|nr:pyrimidine-nucleoside phosphorylase [Clostridia bacterium]
MRIYDTIAKKRDGLTLTDEEIEFFVEEFVKGNVTDYQASALLMAIYIRGMDIKETSCLTKAMAHSGDMVDLSKINGIKVDKHSTGGVGDKTTLIVAPIVASFGVPVAKMSGRGLGHSGGTIDKLESIPGFRTALSEEEFINNVNSINFALAGQTGNLVPADKKLYALRDVTATVESVPLIASSVMSKKIAGGADAIVLDVKCGSGAFMKTLGDATTLAKAMVQIGTELNRKTVALITNMNEPLGEYVGNSVEIKEVLTTLKGNGPEDLTTLCVELATHMLILAGKGSEEEIREKVKEKIKNGEALDKFMEFVKAQGGTLDIDGTNLKVASNTIKIKAGHKGYVKAIDTEAIGIATVLMGGGRLKKEDTIDYSVGLKINKKIGDYVDEDTDIAEIYTNKEDNEEIINKIQTAYNYSDELVKKSDIIYNIIK